MKSRRKFTKDFKQTAMSRLNSRRQRLQQIEEIAKKLKDVAEP